MHLGTKRTTNRLARTLFLQAVRVVVRCRPLNSKEKNDGRQRIVDMDVDAGQVKVKKRAAQADQASIPLLVLTLCVCA